MEKTQRNNKNFEKIFSKIWVTYKKHLEILARNNQKNIFPDIKLKNPL